MKFSHRHVLAIVALVGVLHASSPAAAQTKTKKATPKARPSCLAPITDQPGLPRVLLIGDSISMGYTLPTRAALKGKANVHRPPENCGPTTRGVQKLDKWLGKGSWDVIHFNFGLHDIKYIEGKHQVPLEEYEKNLRRIVQRLKRTKATLLWCSTTPVPSTSHPPRHNEDVVAYNAAAKKIMDKNGILIDDLYAFALPRVKKIQRPKNVHFTGKGSKVLAGHVAQCILQALKGESTPAKKKRKEDR